MEWKDKAREVLRAACTPWGIRASVTDVDNYGAIFTRDAVMAGIAGILIKDSIVIDGLRSTLRNLTELQGDQGQIPSNYSVKNNEIDRVSYGTLSPKIDSCTWYLIGLGLMIREGHIDKELYKDSIDKTINLLDGIEYNGKHLMYIPKGGNWADEYIYEGYILYDQVLRVWGLSLLGNAFSNALWINKAHAIKSTIKKQFSQEELSHFISSFSPGSTFNYFDLAAHAIAGIVFDKSDSFVNDSMDWIAKTFMDNSQLPTAFYPIISEGDEYWDALSKYYLYRFKNMPHHFHNGGIWWIWLGWLAVSLSKRNKTEALSKLVELSNNYLNENAEAFEFDEYIASDSMEVSGTKKLVYTASGIIFLFLAKEGEDFSRLIPTEQMVFEQLTIRKEYFNLSKQLIQRINKKGILDMERPVVAVAGESGSGKSVTAKCLQAELAKHNISSVILHQDGYYKLTPKENHNKRKEDISWVGKDELQLDLIQRHINKFKDGAKKIEVPVVDYSMNQICTTETFIKDIDVLIVEGVYAFFLEDLDFKIFMSRTYKDTIEKRRERLREEYDPFVEQVLEIEHNIVKQHKEKADVIVQKDYSVAIEVKV